MSPNGRSPLPDETLLHIAGPDAATFLQGQLTCDVRQVSLERAVPGLYCSPQGRVLADFILLQLGTDHYALRLRRSIVEATVQQLAKYAVFSKVEVRPDPAWSVSACWGADAAAALTSLGPTLPGERYQSTLIDGACLVQVDENQQQYEIYRHSDSTSQLPEHGTPSSPATWYAQEQARGIARIEPAHIGEFVPQALSYDLAGYISFSKGCYTGQEVIARLHYKGTPKRRLYCASASAGEPPPIGSKVLAAFSTRPVGEVINVVADSNGTIGVLASIATAGVAGEDALTTETGMELSITAPPYGTGDSAENG